MSTIAQNIATQNVSRTFIASLPTEKRQSDSAKTSHYDSLFFLQRTGVTRSVSNDVWHGSVTILGPLM